MKVQFFLFPLLEHLLGTWLSILSRFYFTKFESKINSIRNWLSILSRFYFIRMGSGKTTLVRALSILWRFYFIIFWRFHHLWTTFFQSYQGSILSKSICRKQLVPRPFQSYQGSILSIHGHYSKLQFSLLSILSRFYFITDHIPPHTGSKRLSILSRFYFITKRLKKFSDLFLTFNPIKVLFYQAYNFNKEIINQILSILSRFYFI